MDQDKRPQGREKKTTGNSQGVHKRDEALGTGKVGSKDYKEQAQGGGSFPMRAAIGGGGGAILLILAMLLFKGGGLGSLLGGGGGSGDSDSGSAPAVSGGYVASAETAVNTAVADGARAKRTVIKGNNQDTVTLMIYMCGTDLESKYGMASSDMEEMRQASMSCGDNVNIIVYTGGCSNWKTSGISSSVNQIYQIKSGSIKNLVSDDGSKPMTEAGTLSSFIKYCSSNYPANRNELIFWDHGGGSVSGYGYDEKYKKSGSMDLAHISQALKQGGVKFDFIGFDACLMATAENALMLDEYADYLIASEETEPGIGWYYTNWLSEFGKNTSMSTLDIGKNIIDDFVSECAKKCRGQKTTLSIIDLAEFAKTVPQDLSDFSKSVSRKISNSEYKELSDARYATREFAESSKIDQVDLVNLAVNMGTPEGEKLAESLKKAVKYNRTSTNMTNAYGVSIYFPYKRTSYVDPACSTYTQIGMDSDYAECIRQFAKLETSGQIAAGGSSSPLSTLFGLGGSSGSSGSGADVIGQLLGSFMSGASGKSIDGLDKSNTGFMSSVDDDKAAEYVSQHYFDPKNLVWEDDDGKYTMELPEEQWNMVHAIDMNMFYDDGKGYIDLGIDNLFKRDGDTLIADTDKDWVSVNGQPVAYYHTDSIKDADGKRVDMGYSPAMLNGDRVNLIIVFEDGDGYIAGASTDYVNGETETSAKNSSALTPGDKIDFICDYYSYDMQYQDSYYLGDTITVTDDMKVTNESVGDGEALITYLFTDIYNQEYWSEAIKK
ncbi:MAG: peptidase C11 [Ruminococcus sp.]|nr:peptidase C11 [Ruminococcus sp.]